MFEESIWLLSDVNGLFYYFRSAPYQPKSKYDYSEFEEKKIRLPVKIKSRYIPVIAQLFKKDDNFKDNYNFDLGENSYVDFPKSKRSAPNALSKAKLNNSNNIGLAYKLWGIPNMWGIHRQSDYINHELNAAPLYYSDDAFKTLKMSTAIRCINDPFYEAPEDNY